MKLFWERPFTDHEAAALAHLKNRLDREEHNYLLNVNDEDYIAHVVAEYRLDPLVIDFDGVHASFSEKMIPAERFPREFDVYEGKSYPKQVVRYHLPFSGDHNLLTCIPNPRALNTLEVEIEQNEICFEIINFTNEPERITRTANANIELMRQQHGYLKAQVHRFNDSLAPTIKSILDARRAQILQQKQFIAALGVPIKKATSVPQTFAVPATRKKIHLPKPTASTTPYAPEPTLDDGIYQDILRVMHDTGKVFERLPSTYAGKDEEALRDMLILQLTPHFEFASTTGETFNKNGKTDILIRYDNKNLFVAECKVWKGEKTHQKTIDQLLSYLTWRESKAAIVYFVPTKEMAAPLAAIEASTPNHPCYLASGGKREESWFHYRLHLPEDRGRIIHVAILCFHLPNQESANKTIAASS